MYINNIEFVLRLWIEDENGNTIYEDVFASFEDMNEFLKEAFRNDKYDDCTAQFSPVEVINGVPEESSRFFYDICPIMELMADEIEDFYCDIEHDFRVSKELAARFDKDTQFSPGEDASDFEGKRKHRNEITYICPHCFRELDDCRCSVYSYHLVQIDKLIVPIIRVLNKKGYITTACCSGHIEEDHCTTIYIAFKNEHFFGHNLPEGAVYSKVEQTVKYSGLDKMNAEERVAFRQACIEKLMVWSDNLPNLC